jgi:predicted AlkP superfamily phosphohydrolase/phosphomutase
MPFLKELIDCGVRAELLSVVPALTPPAWTSLATGVSPGRHGIFDFFRKDSLESPHFHIADSRDVSVETVWSLADRSGVKTTVLNFPLMFPPPRIKGHVVPGWMPWRQLRLGCHPEGLFDRLKAIPGFNARQLAMDLSPEAKAIQGCKPEELEDWIDFHIAREQQWFRVLKTLMEEEPSELTAVLFDGVDKLQHMCWSFLDFSASRERLSPWASKIRERCLDYFRQLDGFLAETVQLAGRDVTTVIASDHGFGAQTGTFFVNAWLEQKGYLGWADGKAPVASQSEDLGVDQLARHVYLLDWEKTKAYVPTPSGNGIHIVAKSDSQGAGIPESEYIEVRAQLVEELRAVKDPDTGESVIANIWTREEVFNGPNVNLAPDLTLEMRDGGLVSILASEVPFKRREEPLGAHRPEGVFVAHGPGLKKGARLPELSIMDIAPLLLYSLDLSVPEDMEGKVPEAAFEPEWLDEHRTRYAPATQLHADQRDTGRRAEFTKDDERKLAEHLRKLGYIE